MLSIGDFSKLSRIPVKTLRYYDEIGLFKPLEVDHFINYRHYSASQLPQLNRILALKDLGLSLEQITQILHENISLERMRGMLRLRQAKIQQRMQQEQTQLARVEARLQQTERENTIPDYDVLIGPPAMGTSSRKHGTNRHVRNEACQASIKIVRMFVAAYLPAK